MSEKKKKSKLNISLVTWLIVFAGCILFDTVVFRLAFLPLRWRAMIIVGSLAIALFALILSLLRFKYRRVQKEDGRIVKKKSRKNYVVLAINTILAVTFIVSSVYIYNTNRSLMNVLNANNASNTTHYEIVALKSEYKEKHKDIFHDTTTSDQIKDYFDKTIAAQSASDQKNQDKAIAWIDETLDTKLKFDKKKTIINAVEALYNNEASALLINTTYKSALKNYEKFSNFENETIVLATIDIEAEVVKKPKAEDTAPFTVFVGGNDEYGMLMPEGRFDVNMMVTVNPKTRQILIGSFARDSYVPNVALGGYDKLTHAGVMGVQNAVDTINNYYGTDAEDYLIVNFSTFLNIIDKLGGITINNPQEFTGYWTGNYFAAGEITLDSTSALEYVRERYNLPDGDLGRNAHQQIVLKAIIEKLTSPSVIPNFAHILESLTGSFLTNVDISKINQLASQTLDEGIKWEIITAHVGGTDGMEYTASAPSELLSVVYPDQAEKNAYQYQYNLMMNGQPIPTDNASSSNTESNTDSKATNATTGTVTIKTDALNIRSTPSINGAVVGTATNGQKFYVKEIKQADGYTWYCIQDNQWVADQNGALLTFKSN